jgi:hypothetical protein
MPGFAPAKTRCMSSNTYVCRGDLEENPTALTELPVLHSIPLCVKRQHFAQDLRGHLGHGLPRPAHQLISGLSPMPVIVAHPLADGRGPFAVPFRARCGPFCGPLTNEQPRTRANTADSTVPQGPAFRGLSPIFAAVRGSERNRGEWWCLALQLAYVEGVCGFVGGLVGEPSGERTLTRRARGTHVAPSGRSR